ncbi:MULTISPECIES: hypothetical protein [unclassified Caballeronia]|uniref:amino acid kinase family protein n=1 Tax=unclassified Caballeronia TaxID=2646786 RepID=UPI00202845A3|nr:MULTISPECIES: hypothetical protein [unclassified Caballeronia]
MNRNYPLSVMKFGGSSFSDQARMHFVCQWLRQELQHRSPAHRVIFVVSAPTGLTEQYRSTLLGLNDNPSDRLIDAGLPLADSIGAVMVASALQAAGVNATVSLGSQIGIRTDLNYSRARLTSVDIQPVARSLDHHDVIVIPGGQASAEETGETTWMEKNSSDLSAIALAAAFGCEEVEIFSDVPGVYSCDPSTVTDAHLLPALSYTQAMTMSRCGAKVLHHRGVEHAAQRRVRIVCRANHDEFSAGTVIDSDSPFVPAVIPDTRSRCFAGTTNMRNKGAAVLNQAGVPNLMVEDKDGSEKLVVTCGFFDSSRFLIDDHGLDLQPIEGRLLTVCLAEGKVLYELVPPTQLAERSLEQHARYCAKPNSGDVAASIERSPFSRMLAVWDRTEGVPHV